MTKQTGGVGVNMFYVTTQGLCVHFLEPQTLSLNFIIVPNVHLNKVNGAPVGNHYSKMNT